MATSQLDQILEKLNAWTPVIEKINTIDARTSAMEQFQQQIEGRVGNLEQLVTNHRSQCNVLSGDVHSLKVKVNKLEQKALENDFLMHGLPPSVTAQDVPVVLTAFGAFVGVQLNPGDFREPPRIFLNKNRTSGTIIGSFNSNAHKITTLKAFKAKRPVPVEDIVNLPATSTLRGKPITFRNSLTQTNRNILSEANRLKGNLFEWAWDTPDGRILMRKDADSRPVEVLSTEHLNQVIENAGNVSM